MLRRMPLLVSLVLTLGATGCVDDYTSFYIARALGAAQGCTTPTAQSGATGRYLGSGALDVSLKTGYLMFPQVENHMLPATGTGAVEVNNIALREYRVKLDMAEIPGSFDEGLLKFAEKTSGVLTPGAVAVTSVEVIPAPLAAQLAAVIPQQAGFRRTISAEVRAVGVRTGSEMETAPFFFPVEVCNGCLVDLRTTCPTEEDKTVLAATCVGQDEMATCCNVQGILKCSVATGP